MAQAVSSSISRFNQYAVGPLHISFSLRDLTNFLVSNLKSSRITYQTHVFFQIFNANFLIPTEIFLTNFFKRKKNYFNTKTSEKKKGLKFVVYFIVMGLFLSLDQLTRS